MTSMYSEMQRPNNLVIDLGAVAERTREIRAIIGPQRRFFATLKADAYGFGLLPVARTVLAAGADSISIVNLADAIALREAGIECPILVYAGTLFGAEVVQAYERYRLMPTLHNDAALAGFTQHLREPLACAVKIDVGQERLGVPAGEAPQFLRRLADSGKLRLAVVNAHPYVANGPNALAALQWQLGRFDAACKAAEALGVRIPVRVLASSKVMRTTREMNLDGVDPGQGLFADRGIAADAPARSPLASLASRLIQVRPVDRSEYLDAAPFPVRPGMRLGIVPIGYADGIHRANAGVVLVHGRRVPVLASPSLEYTRIDLTDTPDAQIGDEVVFIGRQGDEIIEAGEVLRARAIARLPDLMLDLKPTIQRIYQPDRSTP